MAVRSSTICDGYVCNTLLPACRTQLIEKVMIVVPGLNSLPGILHLTATSLHHILADGQAGLRRRLADLPPAGRPD